MPFLRPARLPKAVRPLRSACRCNSTFASSAASSLTSAPPAAASSMRQEQKSRPGRLPPSPLLRERARRASPTSSASDAGETTPPIISDVALGSRLSQVLEQGRAVGVEDEERLRELWTDGWARMMSGPSALCIATGVRMPQNLLINFRHARLTPKDPNGSETMVVVPDGILHPDWAASIPADNGIAPPPPLSIICCDIALQYFAGSNDAGPKTSDRARLNSFPHSNFWPVDAPQAPASSPTGAATVPLALLAQVEHQLQDRILQEAFLLAERVRAAGDEGAKLLRSIDQDELGRLRQGEAVREGTDSAGRSKSLAILDIRFAPDEMASFFAGPERNVLLPPQLQEGLKTPEALSVKGLPSHSTCPLLAGSVPFYALQSILPQSKLDLLVPLLNIIDPASAGSATRALQTSADLLAERGLDPFPLFCAIQRLALFTPKTFAWPPEERRKIWLLVHNGVDEENAAAKKARREKEASALPRRYNGQIDVRALLGIKPYASG